MQPQGSQPPVSYIAKAVSSTLFVLPIGYLGNYIVRNTSGVSLGYIRTCCEDTCRDHLQNNYLQVPHFCDNTMAHSPASSIQSRGDSSPPEVSTTGVTRDPEESPSKQGSLRQRRPCKARQHRHSPYESRSPVGSASTSSDESDGSEGDNLTHEQRKLKRVAANSRERKRMHTVNGAFDQLRELVPTYPSNRKLSKIDTLRLACSYISDLNSLLRNPAVVHGDDVQLFHQLHEGYMHGSAFSLPSSYPGVQVKNEYGEYGDYCNYQHYRVQSSLVASASVSLVSAW